MTSNFFSPLSFVAVFGSGIRDPGSGIQDPGSGMGKNQDPGSGIRDKHPGSATLVTGRHPRYENERNIVVTIRDCFKSSFPENPLIKFLFVFLQCCGPYPNLDR
jgi:hypothetical protein